MQTDTQATVEMKRTDHGLMWFTIGAGIRRYMYNVNWAIYYSRQEESFSTWHDVVGISTRQWVAEEIKAATGWSRPVFETNADAIRAFHDALHGGA